MVRLRQWQWKELPTYNGFVHAERVKGWQLINLLVEVGQLDEPRQCAITGVTEGPIGYHAEDYFGWTAYPLSQSVHFALHRRFRHPGEWMSIFDQYAVHGGEWFANLSLTPVDLASDLRRLHGEGIADIFARAPIPRTITIDRS